jgi:IS1 family transposase/lambda repressor-like predicted transcriptional regulator
VNSLKPEKKLAILSGLIEGCSARSVSRMTGCHLETVLKVLVESGKKCEALLNDRMRGLHCEAVEMDEIWSYVYKKQRVLKPEDRIQHPEYGDTYTFVALDPTTKAVVSYLVGKRDHEHTHRFVADLSQRIDGTVQLSTDGFPAYMKAVQRHFGNRATHAEIVKLYASINPGPGRYAPPTVTGVVITGRIGIPDRSKASTSYVERNNWTIRCSVRRFTRLTNAFSKKAENLKAAVSLWFAYYNFCRIHGSLRVTPCMQAGLTDRVWGLGELAA